MPIDASASPTRLSGELVTNGDVQAGYVVGPDGRAVTYIADQDLDNVMELYLSIQTRFLPHAGPSRTAERTH